MKRLDVYLSSSATPSLTAAHQHEGRRLVGTLAEAERRIYFEYDRDFLANPLWLSPFKLPPEPGLHEHRDLEFGPLFGLFDDSLPDGWGLLLMDRYFRRQGIDLHAVSPLDRLAYLGTRTMGALTYHPPTKGDTSGRSDFDLQAMAKEAYQVVKGKGEDVLPQLLLAGGSPGGARPKVLIGLSGENIISGEGRLPEGYAGWIVKFHSQQDSVDEGRIEYAYSEMARAAGLNMPQTRLFITEAGDAFFGVERFDRVDNHRQHVHTFGNMIHANFRVPNCDYDTLMKVTRILTKNASDVKAAFRLMVFNILAHNRDDHVKNFAFVLSSDGDWHLTPAYDLTFAQGPGGEHTMTVAGEGCNPSLDHILRIANVAGIEKTQAHGVIDEVSTAVANWPSFSEAAEVNPKRSREIQETLSETIRAPHQDL